MVENENAREKFFAKSSKNMKEISQNHNEYLTFLSRLLARLVLIQLAVSILLIAFPLLPLCQLCYVASYLRLEGSEQGILKGEVSLYH
jgi:hypothetical protein